MVGFLIRWLATALAIGVAAYLVPGIQVDGAGAAIVAALLLGLVNTVLRPILILLTLPITILTFGLFALVVNGAMLALVAAVVEGVRVAGFLSAVVGALLVSLVATIFTWVLKPRHV
ncbi:MAG: phage holin family protein [Candidatus Methylomirabilales bacterium]